MTEAADAAPAGPSALQSFIRYCAVGVFNLALNLGLMAFLHEVLGAPEELAYAVSLITIFVINFFVSRFYVYEAADGGAAGQLGRFLATAVVFRSAEYAAFLALHTGLGVQYLLAAFGIQVTSFLVKFLAFRFFVFVGAPARAEGSAER